MHSFSRPPCGNGGFRKRAERDAVTSVDAGRPAGMRVSREHKARARCARRRTGVSGPSILLENDGKAAAGCRSPWKFVLAHPPSPVFERLQLRKLLRDRLSYVLTTERLEILFFDTFGDVCFCSREKAWLSAADRVGTKIRLARA